ncbi:MAG: HAD family hydrolase [Culicoidibacterales bacterium]
MRKKAIFFDLDGTLLSSQNTISPETKIAIANLQKLGHKIFIATGRQYYGAVPFHKQLSLDTPLITLNGGAIYEPDGQLLIKTSLDAQFIEQILTDTIFEKITDLNNFETPNLSMLTLRDESMHAYLHGQMPTGLLPNLGHTKHCLSSLPTLKHAVNLYSFITSGSLELCQNYLSDTLPPTVGYRIIYNTPHFLEIFPTTVSKATGIEWVINKLGLHDYETVAFGDGLNDIEMLSYVDIGVSMANAEAAVKESAMFSTTKSNLDSGVADYINKNFL